jgi:hypothetical protein
MGEERLQEATRVTSDRPQEATRVTSDRHQEATRVTSDRPHEATRVTSDRPSPASEACKSRTRPDASTHSAAMAERPNCRIAFLSDASSVADAKHAELSRPCIASGATASQTVAEVNCVSTQIVLSPCLSQTTCKSNDGATASQKPAAGKLVCPGVGSAHVVCGKHPITPELVGHKCCPSTSDEEAKRIKIQGALMTQPSPTRTSRRS